MKHEAIRNLYPNVITITEDEEGVFVAVDENNNIVSIDMDAVNTKATELENNKVDLKASAKQKLMNGEALTEDEANVMVGL
jgi:phosphoenolpyruvate-protein kinase (PTS system EI component)